MTSSHLSQAVDTWTSQAVVASRYLTHLYRTLNDEKQTSNAIRSGAPAEERAQRLGLAIQVSAMQALFVEKHSEELLGEAHAWQALVEAQAGLAAFHAMVDGKSGESHGLHGMRTATNKAFQRALQGYRIAFPEQMAREGIAKAIRAAADRCSETFLADLDDNVSPEASSTLALEIQKNILEVLMAEAGLKSMG